MVGSDDGPILGEPVGKSDDNCDGLRVELIVGSNDSFIVGLMVTLIDGYSVG